MNRALMAAALLTAAIAVIHSVLGQRRIFHRLRHGLPSTGLSDFQIGILWASWHLVTVFGLALAAVLWHLAGPDVEIDPHGVVRRTIAAGMVAGAALVAYGTHGRHPAWAGLLLIGAMAAWGDVGG